MGDEVIDSHTTQNLLESYPMTCFEVGALLLMLRQSGTSSSPEIWLDPESPAFGMAFRHVAKNPLVLEAFEREGYRLIALGGEVARNENQSVTDSSGW